jgi:hypothetical protein
MMQKRVEDCRGDDSVALEFLEAEKLGLKLPDSLCIRRVLVHVLQFLGIFLQILEFSAGRDLHGQGASGVKGNSVEEDELLLRRAHAGMGRHIQVGSGASNSDSIGSPVSPKGSF